MLKLKMHNMINTGARYLACFLGCISTAAFASIMTYTTLAGSSTNDGSVSASATFTTSAGLLSISLQDLLANPKSAGQLLSDLEFTLDGSSGTSTLTSSSSQEISIGDDGTSTLGSFGPTGWILQGNDTNTLTLCVICSPDNAPIGPAHLIIGPGPYTNANGSIAGNKPHNPFLDQTAQFTIANQSISATTTVTSVLFSFGTQPGITVEGVTQQPDVPPSSIPEPTTLALLAIAFIMALGIRRRKNPAAHSVPA
jgi:hypothetical protein